MLREINARMARMYDGCAGLLATSPETMGIELFVIAALAPEHKKSPGLCGHTDQGAQAKGHEDNNHYSTFTADCKGVR